MSEQHGAHQTGEAHVVSLCEDFCKSPVAPVGYMISQKLSVSTMQCSTVNGCGTPALNMSSRISSVTGNEVGVGGGVVSGVNVGMCKPVDNYAPTVRAEGQCLLRHDTVMEMNVAGPDGTGNTLGKIVYMDRLCKDTQNSGPKYAGEPRKIGEREVNGKTVPIYEVDGANMGGGFYDKGAIYLNKGKWSEATLANELQHANDDAADGSFNNKLHKKNPEGELEELSQLEAEARSDQASIDELDKRRKKCTGVIGSIANGICWFRSPSVEASDRAFYANRKKALEAADKKIKAGDYEGAREIARKNPSACSYIESAIENAQRSP